MAGFSKVIVLGEMGTGKKGFAKSLAESIGRMSTPPFEYDATISKPIGPNYKATIGADFLSIPFGKAEHRDLLQVWVTAGQERFRGLGNAFFRGTDAMVYAVDLANPDTIKKSLAKFDERREDFEAATGNNNIPIFIVGMKADLVPAGSQYDVFHQLLVFAQSKGIPAENVAITSGKNQTSIYDISNRRATIHDFGQYLFDRTAKQDELAPKKLESLDTDQTDSAFSDNWFIRAVSSGVGSVIGAVLGGVSSLLIHNPVTCFLESLRATEFSFWSWRNLVRPFLAVVDTLAATADGIVEGGKVGWKEGFVAGVCVPSDVWQENPFSTQTHAVSLSLSLLAAAGTVAAVFFLLPIVGLPLTITAVVGGALFATACYELLDMALSDDEETSGAEHSQGLLTASELVESKSSQLRIVENYYEERMGEPHNYRSFLFLTANGLRPNGYDAQEESVSTHYQSPIYVQMGRNP